MIHVRSEVRGLFINDVGKFSHQFYASHSNYFSNIAAYLTAISTNSDIANAAYSEKGHF